MAGPKPKPVKPKVVNRQVKDTKKVTLSNPGYQRPVAKSAMVTPKRAPAPKAKGAYRKRV